MSSPTSSPNRLNELAEAAGIQVDWKNAQGRAKKVAPEVLRAMLAAMDIAADTDTEIEASLASLEKTAEPTLYVAMSGETIRLKGEPGTYSLKADAGVPRKNAQNLCEMPTSDVDLIEVQAHKIGDGDITFEIPNRPGYYHLTLPDRSVAIAISPQHAPSVSEVMGRDNARIWGPVAQIYSLRSAATASGGYGDFSALSSLGRLAAKQGAHALAISPVHAMFPADPSRYSPYGPSSRLFLNTAYVDPSSVFGAKHVQDLLQAMGQRDVAAQLERDDFIDWPTAVTLRQKVLRALYNEAFAADAAPPPWRTDFDRYVQTAGEALKLHACFDALHADRASKGEAAGGWRDWPDALKDPHSETVQQWAKTHFHDVQFHMFAQWLAQKGLAQAQHSAKEAGMGVGLIADLAVGTDPNGSHAWSRQADLLQGLSSGAPPDIYNPRGQGWGLTAFSPARLRESGYAAFIEMLRSVLAQAGGIRIDHVIGLARTWLIPDGSSPDQGAYLRYPLKDMLRLIALEAWRHDAIVIGENLGTVPDGFNDTLAECGVLGMNVLFFERAAAAEGETPDFLPPEQWPKRYLSTSTTHDLPTCKGWWQARDLDWKVDLGLLGPEETESGLRQQREQDKQAMYAALFAESNAAKPVGLTETVDSTRAPDVGAKPESYASINAPVAEMLAFVARGPQPLVLIPLEDILGLVEQPNIPGTIDEHPNWRRRLPVTTDALFTDTTAQLHTAAIHTARSTT